MRIHQAWGMTETSPVVTFSRPAPRTRGHDERYWDERALQGKPLPWIELRLVGDDGRRGALGRGVDRRDRGARPVDRRALLRRRLAAMRSSTTAGCAPATSRRSTSTRFVRITDRSKDVIKSGGEWISSVELENELMAHPDVLEAAVIAKPDERWAERPLVLRRAVRGRRSRRRGAGRAPAPARREVVAARTSSRSSRRCRRRASASSTRRCCAPVCTTARSSGASQSSDPRLRRPRVENGFQKDRHAQDAPGRTVYFERRSERSATIAARARRGVQVGERCREQEKEECGRTGKKQSRFRIRLRRSGRAP